MMNSKDLATPKRVVPHFENEADEAAWWYDNQDLIEQDFIEALENGAVGHGRTWTMRYSVAPPTPSVITLDAEDEKLASELAASRGESYEAFVRRVVHQALELEKTA